MNNPRIPLHIQERAKRERGEPFQKSVYPMMVPEVTDVAQNWVADQAFVAYQFPTGIRSDYRVDINRTSGNQVFRRFPDGTLDFDFAMAVVLEAIDKVKCNILPLTDLDRLILSVIFPLVFDFDDPIVAAKMRVHQINLSPEEAEIVSVKVADYIHKMFLSVFSQTGVGS